MFMNEKVEDINLMNKDCIKINETNKSRETNESNEKYEKNETNDDINDTYDDNVINLGTLNSNEIKKEKAFLKNLREKLDSRSLKLSEDLKILIEGK